MYCKGCGKQIDDNTNFCPYCGRRQDTARLEAASKELVEIPVSSGEAASSPASSSSGASSKGKDRHGYIQKSLAQDERLIMQVSLGWCCLVPYIIVGAAIFVYFLWYGIRLHRWSRYWYYYYGGSSWTAGQIWLIIIGIIICFLIILAGFLRKRSWEMGFTDRRLIKKNGVIRVRSVDIPLDKINNVILNTGVFGRALGVGSLHILTSSFHRRRGTIGAKGIGVKRAYEFRSRLVDQIKQYKKDRIWEEGKL